MTLFQGRSICIEQKLEWTTRELRQIVNTYLQMIQSVWRERRVCTLYWNIVYWRDFLPTPTDQLYVCICLNSLVVYSTSYFIQLDLPRIVGQSQFAGVPDTGQLQFAGVPDTGQLPIVCRCPVYRQVKVLDHFEKITSVPDTGQLQITGVPDTRQLFFEFSLRFSNFNPLLQPLEQ